MNGKQAKKLRQYYRKDLGKKAQEHAKQVEAKVEEFKTTIDTILKPPPKWMPEFIWVSLQRIFLNI